MPLDVFPELFGCWNSSATPMWNNIIQESGSGTEVRVSLWSYPRWAFALTCDFIKNDPYRAGMIRGDLEKIQGFFLKQQGNFKAFLYKNPNDYHIENQPLGIGDGETATFQAVRQRDEFIEPVLALIGTPVITVGGVTETHFSVGEMGRIVFENPPSLGSEIRMTGDFYYKVRFRESSQEFKKFLNNLWSLQKCELISLKGSE